jgi:hypothetical protein
VTVAHQHPDLHELVDRLSPAQADAVRAVVLQFVAPSQEPVEKVEPSRRRLSFAGTLSAEPELAVRSEDILDEIVTRNAG